MIARQHNLKTKSGHDVKVFEVPMTFFNGLQVCLSTTDACEIEKCKTMVPLFKKYLEDSKKGSRLTIGGS